MQSRFTFIFFLVSTITLAQEEFNGSDFGASREEILALHPQLQKKSSADDTLSTTRWYYGTENKKSYMAYYGHVGGYPVKFVYWMYDGEFLEGYYDFVHNHPDPEKRTAISSTAIREILEAKYGKPDEVVGNITIWKVFERVKYTIELMTTANQSPQILYRWNRRVDAWHRREIKEKSKDF